MNDSKYNISLKPRHFIKYVRKGEQLRLECPYNYTDARVQFMQWFFKPNMDVSHSSTYMNDGK